MSPPPKKVNIDDRPASFDAMLTDHMSFVRFLAKDREDTVQDIVLAAIQKWEQYTSFYRFSTWLGFIARGVQDDANDKRLATKRTGRVVSTEHISAGILPTQLDYAELSETLRRLSGTRDSEALMRVAMGDEYHEIAKDMGVSKQRVHQLVERERARLAC